MNEGDAARVASVTAFASVGALSTAQQIAATCLDGIPGAASDHVAEETLILVATASARAVEVGLTSRIDLAANVVPAIMELPFLYRDYLTGFAMLTRAASGLTDEDEAVYNRLARVRDFYAAHFVAGRYPDDRMLNDKMQLWMGRISPPRLPDRPSDRVDGFGLVPMLSVHLRLIEGFARQV